MKRKNKNNEIIFQNPIQVWVRFRLSSCRTDSSSFILCWILFLSLVELCSSCCSSLISSLTEVSSISNINMSSVIVLSLTIGTSVVLRTLSFTIFFKSSEVSLNFPVLSWCWVELFLLSLCLIFSVVFLAHSMKCLLVLRNPCLMS